MSLLPADLSTPRNRAIAARNRFWQWMRERYGVELKLMEMEMEMET